MRWNFRLRTLLIAVSLTSLPLGYAAVTWQNGGFAIQYDYAMLATIHEKLAKVARLRDRILRASCRTGPFVSGLRSMAPTRARLD